jgi:anhydro-N-acetylmuramic acid kinase
MQNIWALGLMSGTSLDGIDAALIKTDGEVVAEHGPWLSVPYDDAFREHLAMATMREGDIGAVEHQLTLRHAVAVKSLLASTDIRPELIGFHGQTIDHRPAEGISRQLGNGALLAAQTGVDVITDFRRADIAAGGQGAPLVPMYHAVMATDLPKPVAIVNIGGIANVTYVGGPLPHPGREAIRDQDPASSAGCGADDMMAFDTGPGNGLMNRLMEAQTGLAYDEGGKVAAKGRVDDAVLTHYLSHPFFEKIPPKSLDRHDFSTLAVEHLPLEDAMRTLLEVAAQGIARSANHFAAPPQQWLVCGGGVHNHALMARLSELLQNVQPVGDLGWHSDAMEAQAFGYLAVRAKRGLPLTHLRLTGAQHPASGGAFYRGAVLGCS